MTKSTLFYTYLVHFEVVYFRLNFYLIKAKSRDKRRKSSTGSGRLLHPNRADSRGSSGGRRSRGSHDTSGTSGSDTALSDIDDQDARAVTFRVEYGATEKLSAREIQALSAKRRPEIIVSNVQDVGRGGIINTQG